MYKISVIMPIYNVEKYIEQCFESLKNQTIGFENIQVIMIDDYSNDRSYEIAENYAKQYSNCLFYGFDERNGFAGRQRNKGLEFVEGKYIMFVDPDDFYENNACEVMYNAIEEKNADFVTANYVYLDENDVRSSNPVFDTEKYKNFKLSFNDYKDSFFVMNSSVCNKIFKAEFVQEKGLFFLENLNLDDSYFVFSAYLEAKNVYYINDVIYNYRRNYDYKDRKLVWRTDSKSYFKISNEAQRRIYELFKKYRKLTFYRFYYAKTMTFMLYKFIDSKSLSDEDKVEILSEMRWFYKLSATLDIPACQKSLEYLISKIVDGSYKEAIDVFKIISDMRTYMPQEVKDRISKPYDEMYAEMKKQKELNGEGKIVFYFNTIKRGGAEVNLLRYFKDNENNDDKVLMYVNDEDTDHSIIDEFKKYVSVHNWTVGEKILAETAIMCTNYDPIFNNIVANNYIFWAQVNPFYQGIHSSDEDIKDLIRYDKILVPSQYVKDAIESTISELKGRVYMAHPLLNVEDVKERAKEPQSIIKQNECINIITLARYIPDKGYEENLNIAKCLKERGYDFKWYCLGFVPPKWSRFHKKISEEGLQNNMIHLGVESNPYKFLNVCDLNVLFSKEESWGLALTEAKTLGIPSIVSNIGGLKEQVQNGVDSWTFDIPKTKEEYEKIADFIIENVKSPKYYEMKEVLKSFNYNTKEIINKMNECIYS